MRVKINKSVLNKNYNNSIFGGTIFSAIDPFYPVLFHQILTNKGYKIIAWSKSSQIHYLKPGMTDMYFEIRIDDDDLTDCEHILSTEGRYLKVYPIDIYDKKGELCTSITNEIYIRNLNFAEEEKDN